MWGQARLVLTSPKPKSRDAVPQGRGSSGKDPGTLQLWERAQERRECAAGMRDEGCVAKATIPSSSPASPRSCGGMRGRGAGFGMWDSGFGMRGGDRAADPALCSAGKEPLEQECSGREPQDGAGRREEGGGHCAVFQRKAWSRKLRRVYFFMESRCLRSRDAGEGKDPACHPCSVFRFKRSGSSRSSDPGQAGLSVGDGSHQSIFP